MKEINAVLFDLDGTLVDSNQLLIDTFKNTLDLFFPNLVFNTNDYIYMIGPSLQETFSKYEPDNQKIMMMIKHFRNYYKQNETNLIQIYPNVIETLKQLKELNIQTGIVTTKLKEAAIYSIQYFNLDQYIDIFVYLDHVKKPKPDAEPILLAKSMLINPDEIIIIGDNPSDIFAGKNANILTCGVEWTYKRDDLIKSKPHFWITDFNELIPMINQYNKEAI